MPYKEGKYLLFLAEDAIINQYGRLKLEITHDFYLLFMKGKFCGWLLCNPIYYLTNKIGNAEQNNESMGEMGSLLYKYFKIIDRNNISKMYSRDTFIYKDLVDLQNDLKVRAFSVQLDTMLDRVNILLEDFYEI